MPNLYVFDSQRLNERERARASSFYWFVWLKLWKRYLVWCATVAVYDLVICSFTSYSRAARCSASAVDEPYNELWPTRKTKRPTQKTNKATIDWSKQICRRWYSIGPFDIISMRAISTCTAERCPLGAACFADDSWMRLLNLRPILVILPHCNCLQRCKTELLLLMNFPWRWISHSRAETKKPMMKTISTSSLHFAFLQSGIWMYSVPNPYEKVRSKLLGSLRMFVTC